MSISKNTDAFQKRVTACNDKSLTSLGPEKWFPLERILSSVGFVVSCF